MDVQTLIMASPWGALLISQRISGIYIVDISGTPFTMGLVAGLIYGDIATGIILAGSIKLIYGSSHREDSCRRMKNSRHVIPIALKTGMVPEAVAISGQLGWASGAFI